VGTMDNDLAVNDVPLRTLGDYARATQERRGAIDKAEEVSARQSGATYIARAIAHTRSSRARHDLVTQSATFLHRPRRSIRGRVQIELGGNL
jgi:hypothetical protein